MEPPSSYVNKVENETFVPSHDQHNGIEEFESGPQLPSPVTFLRTIRYFMQGLENNKIDIDPEYQRDVVWTADRMSGLIGSLMENLFIPPIILNRHEEKNTENESKHTYVSIDGKQRLTTIKRFIEGVIPCTDENGNKWYFKNNKPNYLEKRRILSKKKQREFLRKEFVSIEYTDLTTGQEEELFSRVQMGVPLNIAERLRASRGPWQELAMCYIKDFPSIYQLIKDVTHAKDFQLTLSCFSQILEVRDALETGRTPTLKTMHTNVLKLIDNTEAVNDTAKAHLAHVWNVFEELVKRDPITFNAEKSLTKLSPFSPFNIVAITVLISLYSESCSHETLLDNVKAIRAKHFEKSGGRLQTWKDFWEWVKELEPPVSRETPQEDIKEPISPNLSPVQKASSAIIPQSAISAGASTADGPSPKRRCTERNLGHGKSTSRSPKKTRTKLPVRGTSAPSPLPLASIPPAVEIAGESPSTNWTPSYPNPKPPVPSTTTSLPPTPSEVRQNRIDELDSYRAPVAPMGIVAPFALMGTPYLRPPPLPRSKSTSNATTKPPPVNPTMKKIPLPVPLPRKSKAQPTGSKRPAPLPPQLDGVIDFTGDSDEEEEQAAHELLTSHKPRALAERQPWAAAVVVKVEGEEKQNRDWKDSKPVELGTPCKIEAAADGYFGPKQRRLKEQTHFLY